MPSANGPEASRFEERGLTAVQRCISLQHEHTIRSEAVSSNQTLSAQWTVQTVTHMGDTLRTDSVISRGWLRTRLRDRVILLQHQSPNGTPRSSCQTLAIRSELFQRSKTPTDSLLRLPSTHLRAA